MKPFLLLILFYASGCTVTRYVRTEPTGERIEFYASSIGTRRSVKSIDYGSNSNGMKTLTVRGYQSDQVEAAGIIAEKVVSGLKGQ